MTELMAAIAAGDALSAERAAMALRGASRNQALQAARTEWRRIGEWKLDEVQRCMVRPHGTDAQRAACQHALVALACKDELLELPLHDVPVLEIARRTRAPWLDQIDALRMHLPFWLVLELSAAGLCQIRTDTAFVEQVIEHFGWRDQIPLPSRIRELLPVMRPVLYRMFEVEGGQQSSLAAADKYRREQNRWMGVFIALTAEGALDRDRVIDATMQSLVADYAAFRAGWFRRLHEALEPTLSEKAARAERYLHLLGSRVPATVSLAVKHVASLEKHGLVDPDALIDALAPVPLARQKGTVKRALKLLVRLGKQDRASAAAELALEAVTHPAPDVQAAALDAIEALMPVHPDADAVRARLAEHRELVAASLRDRLPPSPSDPQPVGAPAAGPTCQRIDPLDPTRALQFPRDLEATVRAVAQALESDDPLLHELAWAGMVVHTRPAADMVGPVRKRARTLARRPSTLMHPLRHELARLTAAWCGAPAEPRKDEPEGQGERIWRAFNDELHTRVIADHPRPLLCSPTHEGGWLAPDAFYARPAHDVGPLEAILALQRLPASARQAAREHLAGVELTADVIDLACAPPAYRFGFTVHVRRSGKHTFFRVIPTTGPHADPPLAPERVREVLASSRPDGQPLGRAPIVRWLASTTPDEQQWLLADGVRVIGVYYDEGTSSSPWHLQYLRRGTPLEPAGHTLLALALGLKPRPAALATDALLDTLADGRLDPLALGATWATLLPTGVLKCARVHGSVAPALHGSLGVRRGLWTAMTRALRGDPADYPRDLAAWLGTLVELKALGGVELDAETRCFLEANRRGGKVRAHAVSLLGD